MVNFPTGTAGAQYGHWRWEQNRWVRMTASTASSPPVGAGEGDLWWDSRPQIGGKMFIFTGGQWVVVERLEELANFATQEFVGNAISNAMQNLPSPDGPFTPPSLIDIGPTAPPPIAGRLWYDTSDDE